jgi:hypothetical protein
MTGSSMTFTYDDGSDGDGVACGIRKVLVAWTSDSATGSVTGTSRKIVGTLIKAQTVPGAGGAAPTDNYDIAITDTNSVDVLGNCKQNVQNRDTANTEEVYFELLNADATALSMAAFPVVCDQLAVAVTNAGNSKTGTLVLYYRPS